jgi:hypothetical protein
MGWGCFWFLVIYGETIYHFLFLMELMCEVVMFVFSLSLPARLVNREISFTRCLHLTILTVSLNSISRIEVEADLVTRFQGFTCVLPELAVSADNLFRDRQSAGHDIGSCGTL